MSAAQPPPGPVDLAPGAEERVRALTGVGARDLLALEGFDRDSGVVVYLSGSLVAGHGNPWSDIDLFAITDRGVAGPFPRAAETNLTSSHFLEGRRVDFEFWRREKVEELAERLAAHRFASGESIPGASFLQIELIFMHRLRIGVPLLDAEGFAELQGLFDADRLAAFLAEEAMRHLDVEVEDLAGMRKGDDRDAALWVARQVLDVSVDAYLHSQGSTDPVHKWRVKHLAALADTPRHRELRETYWRLSYPATAEQLRDGSTAWHAHAEEVLRFSERVAAWAQG